MSENLLGRYTVSHIAPSCLSGAGVWNRELIISGPCRMEVGKIEVSIGDRCVFLEEGVGGTLESIGHRVVRVGRKSKYLSGAGVCSRNKKLSGAGVPPKEKKLSLERTTCLADKTNHPVERLSLNRSQCGSCSTKYDTSAGTYVVYKLII